MVLEYFQKNPQAMQQIAGPIFEDKVIDFILEMAKVTDVTIDTDTLYDAPEETAPAKKASAKKTSAKKTPAKKTPAKKTPAKTSASKKSVAKKAAAKKPAAKK
jgi:trigger factor